MKLIPDFKITPFTRTAWVSTAARDKWSGIIRQCSVMVSDLEVESVAAGQRKCSWQTISRETLPAFVNRCADMGLIVLPVQWVGSFRGFIHYTPPGDSMAYCIISKRLEDALAFRTAFLAGDHEAQGEALGFPACCRKAFAENWKAGFFDPIWQSACGDYPGQMPEANRLRKITAHPYSNPLLRYAGLRVGFHIAHSFNCPETIRAGKERLSLAKDQELVKLLEALLSMPMTAELYHGILQIKTPIFYLITYSVPTAKKYTIHVDGDFLPREGSGQG